jgi:hypothetical protein
MLNVRDEILAMIADAVTTGGCTPMHDETTQTIYFVNDRLTLNADARLVYQFDNGGVGVKLWVRNDLVIGFKQEIGGGVKFDRYAIGDGINFGMLLSEIETASDEARNAPERI